MLNYDILLKQLLDFLRYQSENKIDRCVRMGGKRRREISKIDCMKNSSADTFLMSVRRFKAMDG